MRHNLTGAIRMNEQHAPTTIVHDDLPCRYCGYNLRGLPVDGRCPECNADLNDSLLPDRLNYADPDWLAKIKLGLDLIFIMLLLSFVIGCAGGSAPFFGGGTGGALQSLISLSSQIVHVVAIFLITSQEPRDALREAPDSWRRIARISVVLNLMLGIASTLVLAAGVSANLVITMSVAIMIASSIVIFSIGSYVQQLADRIPDDKMVRSIHIVKWGFLISHIVAGVYAALFFVIAPAVPAPAGGGGAPGAITFNSTFGLVAMSGCTLAVAFIIFSIWSLILLWRFRSIIREAVLSHRYE